MKWQHMSRICRCLILIWILYKCVCAYERENVEQNGRNSLCLMCAGFFTELKERQEVRPC